jgi:hypothetical protein
MGTNFITAKIAFDEPSSKIKSFSQSNNISKKTNNNIIILDWDDTLFSTSYFLLKNKKLTIEEQQLFFKLGECVSKFINLSKSFGKIFIITNSTKKWLFKTAYNYLKINENLLDEVNVISARENFNEEIVPKHMWKSLIFKQLYKYFELSDSIVCISDSINDINEGKKLKTIFKNNNISTIKFINKPSPIQNIKEINLIIENLGKIINSNYNMILEEENMY